MAPCFLIGLALTYIHLVANSKVMQLAYHMSNKLVGLDNIRARPVGEVIDVLQRLKHTMITAARKAPL